MVARVDVEVFIQLESIQAGIIPDVARDAEVPDLVAPRGDRTQEFEIPHRDVLQNELIQLAERLQEGGVEQAIVSPCAVAEKLQARAVRERREICDRVAVLDLQFFQDRDAAQRGNIPQAIQAVHLHPSEQTAPDKGEIADRHGGKDHALQFSAADKTGQIRLPDVVAPEIKVHQVRRGEVGEVRAGIRIGVDAQLFEISGPRQRREIDVRAQVHLFDLGFGQPPDVPESALIRPEDMQMGHFAQIGRFRHVHERHMQLLEIGQQREKTQIVRGQRGLRAVLVPVPVRAVLAAVVAVAEPEEHLGPMGVSVKDVVVFIRNREDLHVLADDHDAADLFQVFRRDPLGQVVVDRELFGYGLRRLRFGFLSAFPDQQSDDGKQQHAGRGQDERQAAFLFRQRGHDPLRDLRGVSSGRGDDVARIQRVFDLGRDRGVVELQRQHVLRAGADEAEQPFLQSAVGEKALRQDGKHDIFPVRPGAELRNVKSLFLQLRDHRRERLAVGRGAKQFDLFVHAHILRFFYVNRPVSHGNRLCRSN